MSRIWREGVRVVLAVLASTSLALGPGLAGAQSQSGSDQTSSESKQPGQGAEAAKNGQKTKSGNSGTGQTAGNVGDRLHDSAKGFGEAILGGIKYAGRKVIGFFND